MTASPAIAVRLFEGAACLARLPRWEEYVRSTGRVAPNSRPIWLNILQRGLRQAPYALEAARAERIAGLLLLMDVRSRLFGRFLVSLPYVNSAGVIADEPDAAMALIDRAVELADQLDVRYLELRHERAYPHPALGFQLTSKVHSRLDLPSTAEELWRGFKPKVRNQIRKARRHDLEVVWGGEELLRDFYAVFGRRMRDLGAPVFGRELFAEILRRFDGDAELCLTRRAGQTLGGAILLHGDGVTEAPSASTLRRHNATNANMLLYWHLLRRAIARGQRRFDFGRSTAGSNVEHFKRQWGARAEPAVWQYHVRRGDVASMRPDTPRNERLARLWRRLPLPLANLLGPRIVRGIP
jgi:FemAB-related protein (PEP-CTERM system-associated)